MARTITVIIELGAPSDSYFTLSELTEMVEANLAEWEFDKKRVVSVTEVDDRKLDD